MATSTQYSLILSFPLFLLISASAFGQTQKHEIKANGLYAVLGIADIHYERITPSKLSLGASINVNARWDEYLASFVIYGRAYTMEEAQKFYLEIHHAIHLDGSCSENQIINYIGPSLGYKHVFNKNISLDIMAGIGFHYLKIDCSELGNKYFPRLGILIGKRF